RPKTGQNGMGIVRYLEGYNASRLFPAIACVWQAVLQTESAVPFEQREECRISQDRAHALFVFPPDLSKFQLFFVMWLVFNRNAKWRSDCGCLCMMPHNPDPQPPAPVPTPTPTPSPLPRPEPAPIPGVPKPTA